MRTTRTTRKCGRCPSFKGHSHTPIVQFATNESPYRRSAWGIHMRAGTCEHQRHGVQTRHAQAVAREDEVVDEIEEVSH
jgi:hypothetical protein